MKKLLLSLALLVALAIPAAVAANLVYFKSNLTATAVLAKAGSVTIGSYNISNPNSSPVFIQVFNAATAGAVTLGTTPPTFVLTVPAANGVLDGNLAGSYNLPLGMVVAATTTATGNTAPTSAVPITIFYSASQ